MLRRLAVFSILALTGACTSTQTKSPGTSSGGTSTTSGGTTTSGTTTTGGSTTGSGTTSTTTGGGTTGSTTGTTATTSGTTTGTTATTSGTTTGGSTSTTGTTTGGSTSTTGTTTGAASLPFYRMPWGALPTNVNTTRPPGGNSCSIDGNAPTSCINYATRFADDANYVVHTLDTNANTANPTPLARFVVSRELVGTGVAHTCALADPTVSATPTRFACRGANRVKQLGSINTPMLTMADQNQDVVPSPMTGFPPGPGTMGDPNGAAGNVFTSVHSGGNYENALNAEGSEAQLGHTCAVNYQGYLWCWGDNANGQSAPSLNDPNIQQRRVDNANDWLQSAAGGDHSCALKVDGSLWCWGRNDFRQASASSDTKVGMTQVVAESGSSQFLQVSAGANHTCAIDANQRMVCWGSDAYGQLGYDSSLLDAPWVTPVNGDVKWIGTAAGARHTCGVTQDHNIMCWGSNAYGQLGVSVATRRSDAPVLTSDSGDWVQVTAGGEHTCGLKEDGSIWCWGHNAQQQCSTSASASEIVDTPTAIVGSGSGWLYVSAGGFHTCGVRARTGQFPFVQCWGSNNHAQILTSPVSGLGSGPAAGMGITQRPATLPSGVAGWTTIWAGGATACALDGDSKLYCWGRNDVGQAGTGALSDVPVEVTVSGHSFFAAVNPNTSYTYWTGAVSVGRTHTCAINMMHQLYCWGSNLHHEVSGSDANAVIATPIGVTGSYQAVSVGGRHSCAIDDANNLLCWGANDLGQLGTAGPTDDATTPQTVPSDATWTWVAAGETSTCAVDSNNILTCWGDNAYGQLGVGTTQNANTPTPVTATDSNNNNVVWSHVVVGRYHACATDTQGYIYCWGRNDHGQVKGALCSDTTDLYTTPQVVDYYSDGDTVRTAYMGALAVGDFHSCTAAYSTDTIQCWGNNVSGQVGRSSLAACDVSSLNSGAALGSGYYRSMAAGTQTTYGVMGPTGDASANQIFSIGNHHHGQRGSGTAWITPP